MEGRTDGQTDMTRLAVAFLQYVGDRVVSRLKPAYHTVTYMERHIPEVVLIQLTLLMMSTWLLETCRELEQTNIRKRIVRQVGYLQRETTMFILKKEVTACLSQT